TKAREESTDRKETKKTEVQNKTKIKPAIASSVRDDGTNRLKAHPSTSTNDARKGSTIAKMPKRAAPLTPPSKRVSKTQYFPSKNLYSNAVKAIQPELKQKLATNSSTEVKINEVSKKKTSKKIDKYDTYRVAHAGKPRDVSPDTSYLSERPRTATLRKGSIVNDNVVGPEAPKLMPKKQVKELKPIKMPSPEPENTEEYSYEEDFESYESDFEAYSSSGSIDLNEISGEETSSVTSSSTTGKSESSPRELISAKRRINSAGTDDERKLDSGNFDMPDYRHKQILDNIKESIEKENAIQINNPASLSDEGFEEQRSLQFINFLGAKRKYEHRKSMELKRKRGEDILGMIRLDTCSFTIFDLPPVPYDDFIKSYGRSNTLQAAVQTGEDDIDEYVQTEEVLVGCKWTQFPVKFPQIDVTDPSYIQLYKESLLGIGSDEVIRDSQKPATNEYNLKKFVSAAGGLILGILKETSLESHKKIVKKFTGHSF
ncbi:hypothetical protein NQ317_014301, partial [Molorchus minor]